MNRIISIGFLAVFAVIIVACGQPAPTNQPDTRTQGVLVPVLAVSELSVGSNRLAFGILKDGTPVNDPNLTLGLRFFYLDGPDKETVQSETTAVYRAEGLPFGLYVAYADLDKPGGWGAEITVKQATSAPQVNRIRLDVLNSSTTPTIGSKAIPSQNLTTTQQPILAQITSDPEPDAEFYQLTIADAITRQKPFVVAFLTPGYCQTAVCSPNMFVLKRLKEQFKDRISFIHIEVYPYPFGESFQQQRRVPAMQEWNLQTEPWTFLVDAEGIIQARYEGGITFAELEPALQQLANGQPIVPLE